MKADRRRVLRVGLATLIVSVALSACNVVGPEAEWVLAGGSDGGTASSPTRTPTVVTPTATRTAVTSAATPSPRSAGAFTDDDCLCPAIGPSDRTVESRATATGLTCKYGWEAAGGRGLVTLDIPRRHVADDPDGSRAFSRKREEHAEWNAGKQGATTRLVEEPRRLTWLTAVDDAKALDAGWRYGLRVVQMKDTVVTLRVNAKGLADEAAVVGLLDEAETCALQAIDAYDAR